MIQNLEKTRLPQLADQLGRRSADAAGYCCRAVKPGRDPRDELPAPLLRTDILSMENLKEGMQLQGTVRNVIVSACLWTLPLSIWMETGWR